MFARENEKEYIYGQYRMVVRNLLNEIVNARGEREVLAPVKAQVTVYDVSCFRFPLVWSRTFTVEEAESAVTIFNAVGYFDIE